MWHDYVKVRSNFQNSKYVEHCCICPETKFFNAENSIKKIVSRLLGNSESNEKYSRVAKTSEDYHMIVSSCQSLPRDRKFPIF